MSAETSAQPASDARTVRTRLVALRDTRERSFWIGLACAAIVHAAVIVGAVRSLPRQMGEASGRPDGISVELVDAADLQSKNTFAEDGSQPGAQTPAQKQPPSQATPPAPPPVPPADTAQPAPPAPEQKADPRAAEKQDLPALPEAADQSKAATKPAPAKKPQPAEQPPQPQPQPQPKPQPQQKQALQFDLPPEVFVAPGTRGAAVARPPGVTRSGENDEFGRGVIRALRKTMPSSSVLGRVTVRFFLSGNGNLVDVRLVGPSGDPVLNQNVVFAVKQSSFPIPPSGSTEVDRTFMVTYVYH
jgi:periplasmic protein TonB